MRLRNIGMLLMFCAIGLMGYQIGATAKKTEQRPVFPDAERGGAAVGRLVPVVQGYQKRIG